MNQNFGDVLAADDDVAELAPRKPAPINVTAPVEKRIRIVLEENENIPPTGQFFSINGRTFMLRPGDAADVPEALVNVLNDAVQDVPQIDQQTKQVIGYRKKLRFPYRVVQQAA